MVGCTVEIHVDEIGIIVGVFFILCHEWMYKQKGKKKKTYLVPSLFFLSVLSSFLSSQYSLSRSLFFSITKMIRPFLFFLWLISLFFHIILIDIFFKMSVVQFREVTALWLIHIYYFFNFLKLILKWIYPGMRLKTFSNGNNPLFIINFIFI